MFSVLRFYAYNKCSYGMCLTIITSYCSCPFNNRIYGVCATI
nr:MAG TPA: hypothetical protein [Caudoviricetes sp.]